MRRPSCDLAVFAPHAFAMYRRLPHFLRRTGRPGANSQAQKKPLYALSGFSASNYYSTASGGGEAGVATGYGVALLMRVNRLTGVNQRLTSVRSSGGWDLVITGAGDLTLYHWTTTAAYASAGVKVNSTKLGQLDLCIGQYTGSLVRVLVDALSSISSAAATAFQLATSTYQRLGSHNAAGVEPPDGCDILGVLAFRGLPTDAQLRTLCESARTSGDVPSTFSLTPAYDADIAAMSLPHWYCADTVTPSGGNLGALPNRGTAGGEFAVSGGTIALPAPFAALNNAVAMVLDGSQHLTASHVPAEFKRHHDGSGGEFVVIGHKTDGTAGCVLATINSSLADVGFYALWNGLTMQYRVANGGAYTQASALAPGAAPTGVYGGGMLQGAIFTAFGKDVAGSTAPPTLSAANPTNTMRIGQTWGGAFGFVGAITDIMLGPPLTPAQRLRIADYARTKYGIGAVVITHRWSAREALAGMYNPVGRKTYGARGFTAANRLESASGAGLGGADAGCWFGFGLHFTGIMSGVYHAIVRRLQQSPLQGYSLTGTNSVCTLYFYNNGQTITNGSLNISGYLNRDISVLYHYDGTQIHCWIDGTNLGAGAAKSGTAIIAGAVPMTIGADVTGTTPFTDGSVSWVAGGNYTLTAGEIAAYFADTRGRGIIPDKTDHAYDLDADIAPTGTVPTLINDTVGGDDLTRVGGWRVQDGGLISGETGTASSTATVLRTGAASLPGSSASAFSASFAWYDRGIPLLTAEYWMGQATFDVLAGWSFFSNPTGTVGFIARANGAAIILTYSFGASVPAGAHHLAATYDGSVFLFYVDGTLRGTSAAAQTFEPAAAEPLLISGHRASAPIFGMRTRSALGGYLYSGTWDAGEIATAAAADIAAAKPLGIAGKTGKRWSVVDDVTEAGGKVPALIKERVSNIDHMIVIGAPLQPALAIATGPAAPASLPDTITGAGVDVMARVGSPTVRSIDTSVDGRRTYGALGFSATNSLETGPNLGITGAQTGFWVGAALRADVAPSGVQFVVGTYVATAYGWALQLVPQLRFSIYDSGGTLIAATTYTVATADVLQRKHVVGHYTGSVLRLYVDGLQVGADVAAPTIRLSAGAPMRLGHNAGTQPAPNISIFEVGGGHANPTIAEIQQSYADFVRTGKLQPIPGKTDHLYDPTTDITANGGPANGIPTQVLDRIGTDHLTRVGWLEVVTRGSAKGVRGFVSGSGPYVSALGIAGAATNFWAGMLVSPRSLTGIRVPFGRSNHSNAGWYFYFANAYVIVKITDATTTIQDAGQYIMTGANVDALLDVRFVRDGSGAVQLYINGAAVGSPVAITGYTPSSTMTTIGATNGGALYGATDIDFFGGGGGDGYAPSAGEIATAAAESLSSGVFASVPGKTTHSWIPNLDIGAGSAAPRYLAERISGTDRMQAIGAPLQAAQRVERVWSYERDPILYGANGFSLANHYASTDGIVGTAAGFWGAALFRVDSQAVASKARLFAAKRADAAGWQLYINGTNALLLATVQTSTTYYHSPMPSITAADVGRLLLAVFVYDAPLAKLRMYWKRAEQGTGSNTAGTYAPAAVPMRIGRSDSASDASADNVTVFAIAGGDGVPTLAQVQALHDACMTEEDIPAYGIPGITNVRYSFTAAARAAGGLLPSSVPDTRGNGAPLIQAGSPTLAPFYSCAWGW